MYTVVFVIYLIICLVLLLLWGGVFGSFLLHPKPLIEGGKHSATSIIIAARNERAHLNTYLPAILNQLAPSSELIVVNNHSNDQSSDLLQSFSAKNPALRVLERSKNDEKGKKSALLAGIQAAKHNFLLFTDADCAVGPLWLRKMALKLNDVDICLGYGGYFRKKGWLNALIRFETVVTAAQYMGMAFLGKPYMAVGRNLAYKKGVFEAVGGYANHMDLLSGDDDLFIQEAAAKHRVGFSLDPETFTYSEAPSTVSALLRQKRRHVSTSSRYLLIHQFWLGGVGLANLLFYPLSIFLLIYQPSGFTVILCLSTILLKWLIFAGISARYKETTLMARFVILDILYCLYLWVMVPALFMNRPRTWN